MQVALRNILTPPAPRALGLDIDDLGALRARIAALEAEEKLLAASVKARLIEHGREAVKGGEFLAAINVAERVTLDGKAAEALLVANGLEVPRRSQVIETLRIVKLV
jgi:hypothetical protein